MNCAAFLSWPCQAYELITPAITYHSGKLAFEFTTALHLAVLAAIFRSN